MKPLRIAIVGATGLVGETLLRILEERRIPVAALRLMAGSRSAGSTVRALGRTTSVEPLDASTTFEGIEVAFFAAGSQTSLAHAVAAANQGALVIDKSEAFRLDPAVPLVVPEVNSRSIRGHKLIANPNCATIPLAVALGPIYQRFGLEWVSVATYQSVSGAGREALEEFERQLGGDPNPAAVLPRRIAGNLFPENGAFGRTGYGEEERKIAAELRKVLGEQNLPISATSVRVPVAIGHGEAVSFKTKQPASLDEIARTLREAPGVKFLEGSAYATPLEVQGTDDVAVGRLRPDSAHAGGYLAWVMSDNLRKGAATNAVQIAEIALAPAEAPA